MADAGRHLGAIAGQTPPDPLPANRKYGYPWIGLSSVEDRFDTTVNVDRIYRTEDLDLGRQYNALLGWSDQRVRWRADGGAWNEQAITALTVCNGRYFGGGMKVAPDAEIDDGLFDVVVWSGLGIADFVTKRSMLYDGTHVKLPNTRVLRARRVEAEPVGDERVLLDVDGEQPGRLPARFTMLPGALRVRVAGRE